MPETFTFLNPDVRLWVPLAFTAEERAEDRRYSQNHDEIARLAPGVTLSAGASEDRRAWPREIIEQRRAVEVSARQRRLSQRDPVVGGRSRARRPFGALLLWGGVACLLLIAAVNITNLSLARATGRLKEVATRHALGAARAPRRPPAGDRNDDVDGHRRSARPGARLLESWRLEVVWARRHPTRARDPHGRGRHDAHSLPAAALGVIVGVVPAMHIAGVNLSVVLREDSRTGTAGRGARAVRGALVVAQVALAFVLLIGAGLLMASFRSPAQRRSRIHAGAGADGSSVAAGGALSRRQRVAVLHQSSARAHPCAARRRSRGRHELSAVQSGTTAAASSSPRVT